MSHRPLRATFGRTDDGRVQVEVIGLGNSFVPASDDDDDDDGDEGDDSKSSKGQKESVEVRRLV